MDRHSPGQATELVVRLRDAVKGRVKPSLAPLKSFRSLPRPLVQEQIKQSDGRVIESEETLERVTSVLRYSALEMVYQLAIRVDEPHRSDRQDRLSASWKTAAGHCGSGR